MSRGVLRQMLNCPVNFTHIYCTVPVSRVSFSAIEKTKLLYCGRYSILIAGHKTRVGGVGLCSYDADGFSCIRHQLFRVRPS